MMYIMALSNLPLTAAVWYWVTVVKLCMINGSSSRTVHHAFSQTSIYDADASILLNDLWWQNLETQQQIHKAVMVYKPLNCLAPDYIQNSYYTVIYLIPTTLEMLKISLLFLCHEPVNIEMAFATAGLFSGTICPLM